MVQLDVSLDVRGSFKLPCIRVIRIIRWGRVLLMMVQLLSDLLETILLVLRIGEFTSTLARLTLAGLSRIEQGAEEAGPFPGGAGGFLGKRLLLLPFRFLHRGD